MTDQPNTRGFHHVAYRCRDAKEIVEFYTHILGMDFQLAIAEDHVPSTGEYDPYMHIFHGRRAAMYWLDLLIGQGHVYRKLTKTPIFAPFANHPAYAPA